MSDSAAIHKLDEIRGLPADEPAEPMTPSKPVIQVQPGQLDELATAGETALRESGLPIFQRGRSLVRPYITEVPASGGRTTMAAGLAEIGGAGMLDHLSQAADWQAFNIRRKIWAPCDPPGNVGPVILSRVGNWTLPRVAGVITTPTIRPDGSILSQHGYDPASRLYHAADPALVMPRIPDRPTRKDAIAALALVESLLTDFPLVSKVDRAVALSAIITPTARGALPVTPLHGIRASTAGTGKSYLVDLVSAVSTGRPCPVLAAGSKDEETEKRLTGLLLAGFPIVSIDNVNGELGGDLLCQAVERPLVRVRPLGRSDIVEIESRATLYATGNNLRLRGDMTRRSLLCGLDAGVERPELRNFTTDPVGTVMAGRGRFVAACLTIIRAYLVAGCPEESPPLASFAEWSRLVRSALVWLGCDDPCVSMEAAREDDPELAELREVLALWRAAIGSDVGVTVKELADRAFERNHDLTDFEYPDLRDCLLRIAGERGSISSRRLGQWMKEREGRIVDGYRIRKAGTAHGGLVRWAVQKA